ncbi:Glutamate-ammonia-ligase adenylyltransferase [Rubripirellula tenax]|uniref:Glutamate-ammonia-ligase adenylyltransferase n=1 Tax=Rubripirellula tenax TaxID=2528015 RepID=A0A5C6FIE1_9BACT|nr:glutamate-ammonia-ligase adenylyltransferase [Rubripirellula tenax]TWU60575.1 Glutamate-ammonia-ligase adenylyltransferase [Rubripirellula tenax]
MDAENLQIALRECLTDSMGPLQDTENVLRLMSRFVRSSKDPDNLVQWFQREPLVAEVLGLFFSSNPALAERLIADPQTFDLISASHHHSHDPAPLLAELTRLLSTIDQPKRAALVIRKFYSRHIMRIAFGEFVRGDSPDMVGRQIAHLSDAILDAGLRFTLKRLADLRGMPERADGSIPEITVIGLGNLGGEEIGYASPMRVIFLYDAIDHKNVWHGKFYSAVVADTVKLLCGDAKRNEGVDIDLREGPRHEVGVHICGFREAARIYETSGRTWQRLTFIKARVVAGSRDLGKSFLARMEPWIYRQFISRVDRAEIRSMRHKISRRAETSTSTDTDARDVVHDAGGRADLELTIQFLQLFYGGHDRSIRKHNTLDAINSLHRAGHLDDDTRVRLADNYAKLCRLQHQLSIAFAPPITTIPADAGDRQRLAWQLGLRNRDAGHGDDVRFDEVLKATLIMNRQLMNELLVESLGEEAASPAETDLLLDPDPDPDMVEATLKRYKLKHPRSAMADLASLSTETVPFLSPLRCRHIFSSIAPKLLAEVAQTPNPDAALHSMVKVTDSLGAKATLWELLDASPPTMQLMVRLCAGAPYLTDILTDNPGMIDELVDSLVINRLPSADRLDAHSIELCKGAAEIDDILRTFKSGAHLMIGVRDMLGKETLEATHQAIGDCAEACLRRVIQYEQEIVADQYGDPVDAEGNASEMITLALGKLGGREPNYQSDLDAIFLYSVGGETQRRIGGRRSTTTNRRFFNQVARQVVSRINHPHPSGQLYELDSRLRPVDESGPIAITVDEFLDQFQTDAAPLWMRLALCKARAISGSRVLRREVDASVAAAIATTVWEPAMATEIRQMRLDLQETAQPENLKRGAGGTMDVEYVAQMLTLRHAKQTPAILRQGTTASLRALAEAGYLSGDDAEGLIGGYRTLRRIEASLRLMLAPARHAMPSEPELLSNLAFLMGQPDSNEVLRRCESARTGNRKIFDRVFDEASA